MNEITAADPNLQKKAIFRSNYFTLPFSACRKAERGCFEGERMLKQTRLAQSVGCGNPLLLERLFFCNFSCSCWQEKLVNPIKQKNTPASKNETKAQNLRGTTQIAFSRTPLKPITAADRSSLLPQSLTARIFEKTAPRRVRIPAIAPRTTRRLSEKTQNSLSSSMHFTTLLLYCITHPLSSLFSKFFSALPQNSGDR